jgi:DNA-binding response OmpR family regulator
MTHPRVLIVEDDALIAMDVEEALQSAGYIVCGIAASETEALAMAIRTHPDFAVVDISLSPGDGRVVARELWRIHHTAVLFATGQCEELRGLLNSGAIACLPKPYQAAAVPRALHVIDEISHGHSPERLPDHMFALRAA